MKKVLALLIYITIIAATRESGLSITPRTPSEEIIEKIRVKYDHDLDQFAQSITAFRGCVDSAHGTAVRESCGDMYRRLRDSYKRIEFLVEFLDNEAVTLYFNGAPLKTIEPHVPQVVILDPEGLQVIDELMYLTPEESVDVEELDAMLGLLDAALDKFRKSTASTPLNHQHIWNGSRTGIIRLHTLGITGFDTPGDGMSALPDTRAALQGMSDYLAVYKSLAADRLDSFEEVTALFAKADGYLSENDDFDTFDRLEFTIDYLNPLFAGLLDLQRELGVEFPREYAPESALNLEVRSLYDIEIFNKAHFANIVEAEMTDKRIDLGRTLFYDPALSSTMKQSCATCHDPKKGFTDGLTKSLANTGEKTILRNSPTLLNCVYTEKFFYDLREDLLERQIKHVVKDPMEFNTDFIEIVDKLKQSEEYVDLFAEAYAGSPYQLSKWSVSDAIATYVASLTSFESTVDQYIAGKIDKLDASVYNGYNLFMGKAACGTCHFAPNFNGLVPPFYEHSETEVLGVPVSPDTANAEIDPDLGRVASGRPEDEAYIYVHAFKTPTVRNIALTAPYMHNGVYETLEEVVDFYNRGGGAGIGITLNNQTLPDAPLDLTSSEIADLVSFMEALTDTTGLTGRPATLPVFEDHPKWNARKVAGDY